MFRFENLRYKNILNISELEIDGRITLVTGPSGGGKTTLLRLMNKLISPTEGTVCYNGRDLETLPAVAHRRQVIMLSQQAIVFEGNVRDNLLAGFTFREEEPPKDATLEAALSEARLSKGLEDDPERFSGGERQRLALARVLLLEPDVFLLDEPAASLDDDTEERILETLQDHAQRTGRRIVMVTHARQMAESMSDQVVTIENGTVVDSRRRP